MPKKKSEVEENATEAAKAEVDLEAEAKKSADRALDLARKTAIAVVKEELEAAATNWEVVDRDPLTGSLTRAYPVHGGRRCLCRVDLVDPKTGKLVQAGVPNLLDGVRVTDLEHR